MYICIHTGGLNENQQVSFKKPPKKKNLPS
jgi:hypothetical protein